MLAALMGVEPPPEIPFASAQLAHGAVFLWREQARLERGDKGERLQFPLSGLSLWPSDAMWAAGDWAGEGGKRRQKPDEALALDAVIEALPRKML